MSILLTGPAAVAAAISAATIGGAAIMGQREVNRYTKLGGEEAGNLAAERQTDEYLGAGDPGALGSAIMNAGEETKGEKINKLVEKKQNLIQELVAENGFNKVGVTPQGEYIFKNKEDVFWIDARYGALATMKERDPFPSKDTSCPFPLSLNHLFVDK